MKQTAVEWFMDKLDNELELYNSQWLIIESILEKTKEIEKQQIKNAFIEGEHQQGFEGEAKQYYKETFNK